MIENEDNIFKNLILFGANGSGKTTFLNKIIGKKENEKNIFVYNKESLKDSYDNKTNSFKKEITNKEKELKKSFKNEEKPFIDKEKYSKCIKDLNEKYNEEINLINNELKISFEPNEINEFFNVKSIIELNSNKFSLDEAPSGVKKIISLKFEIDRKIKDEKNKKILIIIDEFENHLHPTWIKIICDQIDQWIKNENIYVMLSTHSPLVLENLKDHIKYFRTIEWKNDSVQIKKINEENLLEEFNKYISKIWGDKYKLKDYEDLLKKVNPRLVFELSKIFFSQNREIIFVEGITDKIFFENKTKKIIINMYGNHNIPYTLFLAQYAGIHLDKISYILDGDGNLEKEEKEQFKTQKFLNNKEINNYYFKKDIEQNLYGTEKIEKSFEKFNLATEWKNEEIELPTELKTIL